MDDFEAANSQVIVQLVALEPTGEIGWRDQTARLAAKKDQLRHAVVEGVKSVASALPSVPPVEGWEISELKASFGLTLTAEGGVLLAKSSVGTAFEVAVTFARKPAVPTDEQ